MKPILALVYTSRTQKPIEASLLNDILGVSRERNLRDQITGFLAVRQGYFLQLLEGPEGEVRACYERILADRRHSQITLQGEAGADTRLMPNWSMGLVDPADAASSSSDLINLFELGRAGQKYASTESLMTMLRLFSKSAQPLT